MIVGIDLGTTNSLVSYFKDGEAKIIPNRDGERLTPSVVSIDSAGTVYVGRNAKERKLTFPEETAEVFKRSMGTKKKFKLGDREFQAIELSSIVLKKIKEDAENYLGETITEAVISVPAYFNDTQRKATKQAGEIAGLVVERIISEPTAAAIAYGIHQKNADTKFLVFDLGGGTFDVSIIELYKNIMEVRAVAGDNFLGGEDFTRVLIQLFLKKFELEEDKLDKRTNARLNKQAEICKKGFSDARVSLFSCKINDRLREYEINIEEYEEACQLLLTRIKKPIERSLNDANIKLTDIEEIILVGGATKLPIVRKYVSKLFGRLPNISINPDEVVAIGAATQAAMKERDEAVKEMILTDVCPFTLGTSIVNKLDDKYIGPNLFSPIIERNTVIPVSRVKTYYTARDNQEQITIDVLQGESRFSDNNVLLDSITVEVPKAKEGKECVDVTYTYDINSLLEVEVTVVSTKKKSRLIIKNEENTMTDQEIEERFKELSKLKIKPKDQEENVILLLRGDRLYEEAMGDIRTSIQFELKLFEAALETQDNERIYEARTRIKEFFEMIDGEIY